MKSLLITVFLLKRLPAKLYTVYLVIKPPKHTPSDFFLKDCIHKGSSFVCLNILPNTYIFQKHFKCKEEI